MIENAPKRSMMEERERDASPAAGANDQSRERKSPMASSLCNERVSLRETRMMVRELNRVIDAIIIIRDRLSLAHTLGDRTSDLYVQVTGEARHLIDRLKSIKVPE